MQEIKSTMRKNENHYERLTNAKSSQDLLLLQAAKQRKIAQFVKHVPRNLMQTYSPTRSYRSVKKRNFKKKSRSSLSGEPS